MLLRRLAVASAALALLACPPKPTLSMDALIPPLGNVGTPYSVTFSASGAQGAVAFTSTGTLPPGLALATSGTLSGTPTAAGQYSFAIVATDSVTSVRASYGIEVLANPPPSIATATLPDGAVGRAYGATLVGEAGQTPYAWSVSSGALPAGVSLSSSGALSGTPTAAGTSSFQVRLVDARGQSAMASLSISILNPPAIATAALDDGYAGLSYAFAFQASSGAPPYTWALSSGALPAGLGLSTSGVVTGTPQAAGVSSFTVRVTDSAGLTDEKAFTLAVYEPLALETFNLPDGVVGLAYSANVVATGGKTPLTFSVLSGALPPGLALDPGGRISGTPAAGGTWSFTAFVYDANGRFGTASLSVTIGGGGASIQLPVAAWNIEWFGDTLNGPTDDPLQLANVSGVIADAGFPLWGVEEIFSTTQFQALLATLPGYSGFLADDPRVPGGTTYYSTNEQKVGVVYQTSRVTPVDARLILTADEYLFAGRPPLRVDFQVDGGGPLTLVVLHMKAGGTSPADWSRRGDAGVVLKGYLDQNMPADRVLVVGDWNDDVDQSIVTGLDTPYRPIIDDTADYHFVTDYLSYLGIGSMVYYTDTIDHHLATNEMDALQVGNPEVVRPDLWATPVASYGTTTSDHYPVVSRYAFGSTGGGSTDAGTPLLYLNEVLYDEPSDGGFQLYDYEFVEVRNAGDGPADLTGWQIWDALNNFGVGPGYMRHTFAAGTTLAPGKAIVVFGAAAGIPPGLTNAVPASTLTLSLHPSDSARLLTPSGVQQDILTWTYNWGDGLSANRSPDGDPYGVWLPHTSVYPPLLSSPGTRADGTSW